MIIHLNNINWNNIQSKDIDSYIKKAKTPAGYMGSTFCTRVIDHMHNGKMTHMS